MALLQGAALFKLADKILDGVTNYFPNAEQKEAAKAAARNAIIEGKTKLLEAELEAIVMEAKSEDPWTSRARPAFLWVMYTYILMGIPMGFLAIFSPETILSIGAGMQVWLKAIPEPMWYLFGTGYLGYTGARTWDKHKHKDVEMQKHVTKVKKVEEPKLFDDLPPQGPNGDPYVN